MVSFLLSSANSTGCCSFYLELELALNLQLATMLPNGELHELPELTEFSVKAVA